MMSKNTVSYLTGLFLIISQLMTTGHIYSRITESDLHQLLQGKPTRDSCKNKQCDFTDELILSLQRDPLEEETINSLQWPYEAERNQQYQQRRLANPSLPKPKTPSDLGKPDPSDIIRRAIEIFLQPDIMSSTDNKAVATTVSKNILKFNTIAAYSRLGHGIETRPGNAYFKSKFLEDQLLNCYEDYLPIFSCATAAASRRNQNSQASPVDLIDVSAESGCSPSPDWQTADWNGWRNIDGAIRNNSNSILHDPYLQAINNMSMADLDNDKKRIKSYLSALDCINGLLYRCAFGAENNNQEFCNSNALKPIANRCASTKLAETAMLPDVKTELLRLIPEIANPSTTESATQISPRGLLKNALYFTGRLTDILHMQYLRDSVNAVNTLPNATMSITELVSQDGLKESTHCRLEYLYEPHRENTPTLLDVLQLDQPQIGAQWHLMNELLDSTDQKRMIPANPATPCDTTKSVVILKNGQFFRYDVDQSTMKPLDDKRLTTYTVSANDKPITLRDGKNGFIAARKNRGKALRYIAEYQQTLLPNILGNIIKTATLALPFESAIAKRAKTIIANSQNVSKNAQCKKETGENCTCVISSAALQMLNSQWRMYYGQDEAIKKTFDGTQFAMTAIPEEWAYPYNSGNSRWINNPIAPIRYTPWNRQPHSIANSVQPYLEMAVQLAEQNAALYFQEQHQAQLLYLLSTHLLTRYQLYKNGYQTELRNLASLHDNYYIATKIRPGEQAGIEQPSAIDLAKIDSTSGRCEVLSENALPSSGVCSKQQCIDHGVGTWDSTKQICTPLVQISQ